MAELLSFMDGKVSQCGLQQQGTPEESSQLEHHASRILSAAYHKGGEGAVAAAHARLERIVRAVLLAVGTLQPQQVCGGVDPSLRQPLWTHVCVQAAFVAIGSYILYCSFTAILLVELGTALVELTEITSMRFRSCFAAAIAATHGNPGWAHG